MKPNAFAAESQLNAGEGFLAVKPDGTSYRFDWLVRRTASVIYRGSDAPDSLVANAVPTASLLRTEVLILPTEIRDRFGNRLVFKYNEASPWQLESISSDDGRVLAFSYVPGSYRIASISDGTRTWRYDYGTDDDLRSVEQPDGKLWTFSNAGVLANTPAYSVNPDCSGSPGALASFSATPAIFQHPSGARGEFRFQSISHGRSFVPEACYGGMNPWPRNPAYFATVALAKKTLLSSGTAVQEWSYDYPNAVPGAGSWSTCVGNCPDTKVVTVTAPGQVVNRYTYGTRYEQTEGILLKQEEGYSGGSAMRVTAFQHRRLNPVGYSISDLGDSAIGSRPMPLESRVVSQQGASFSWVVDSMDTVFARPLTVTRKGPGGSRSETISYADNTNLWVLGQVDSITSNGLTVVDNDYFPSNAMLRSSSKFGVFQHRFTYNTDGTMASRTDGRNHTTYFNNYKRGLPQSVSYPDGTSESAEVNDLGLVTSVTSAASYTTHYAYDDPMGRLTGIHPPAGWASTSLAFEQVWAPEYGLPAGHWRQTISKGNARTITYFDAFWRPVMTRSFDLGDEANTRKVTVKSYGADGRVSFESYPQRDFSTVAVSSPGKRSTYDALGRLKQQDADSELGTLLSSTEYLSGFQVRHTNPLGKQSTQTLWALDNPSESQLSAISVPAGGGLPGGMSVSIARDAFGKPTSISRSGSGVSVTRSYVYDSGQRLCKTVEPEVGATIQNYDAAGNIDWRAPGVGLTSATCDRDSVPESARIKYGHDPVNQLETTVYGDGSPAITRTYWPDGKLKTIGTGSGDIWSYSYNSLRLLDKEKFDYAGQAFEFLWSYDSNGSLSSLTYPGGSPLVTYSPNALGEPRSVGAYASAVKFHPNGAVESYTLGNTIAHSLTQNLRGLPLVNRDAGVMQDQYSYDANGNVTGIVDQQEGGLFNRAMTYDDLDRLWTANSPGVWGNATYTYDAVDNLKTAVVGNRNSTLNYDASNKLSSIVTNGSTANYLYDPRGNVRKKGLQSFEFDLGNRLKSSSLGGGYLYDGHGRRIQITGNDGVKRLQLYSQAGQILWSETVSAGTVPAVLTYVCAVGTQVNGQCVSTSTYPATQNYVCNAGDGAPVGGVCTHVTSSNYAATITGYSCNAGDGAAVNGVCYHTTTSTYTATVTGFSCSSGDGPAVNGVCTHVSSSSYPGTVAGYSCNAGDGAAVGGVCTHTVSNTYVGTPTGYGCNAGDGAPVSGVCTHTTVLSAATPVYVCPAGFTLNGTTCYGNSVVPATPTLTCNGHGSLQPDGHTCLTVMITVGNVNDDPEPVCQSLASGMGLTLLSVDPVPGPNLKRYNCVLGAVPGPFSCPGGGSLNGSNQCVSPVTQSAVFDRYQCSSGTVSGSSCIATSSYSATPTGYACNTGDGQPASGGVCTHVSSSTYPGTVTGYTCNTGDGAAVNGVCTHTSTSTYAASVNGYSCNAGDGPAVNGICTHTSTSSYAGVPSGYSCNAGDGAPINGQCTHVVSSSYSAIWKSSTCNAGDGSATNGVCSHTTVLGAASPVYSCPNGATPTPQHTCPGATTRVGTAYIYLGGKQISEVVVGGATQYVHTDALGSPVAHTNASGALLNRTRFEPYGFTAAGTKPGPNTSSIGFTGHVNDPETDLVYMQQRYYDPIAGRFLSVDPVVTDADSGVGFGRYTYVNNRPYSGTDPDGRFSNDDCRAMAGNCEVVVDGGGGGGDSNWRSKAKADGNHVSTALENGFDSVVSEGAMIVFPPLIMARGLLGTPRSIGDYLAQPTIQSTAILGITIGLRLGAATKGLPRFDGPKPSYHINPAHVPGQRGFNPQKTPLPNDAQTVFGRAVPNDPKQPTAWFGKNADGQIYRYSLGNDGTAHFSGIDGVGDGVRNLTKYARDRLGGL